MKVTAKQLYGRTHFSQAIGISAQTAINLEERGIVNPQRDSSGKRLYSDADVHAARKYMSLDPKDRRAKFAVKRDEA